MHYIKEWELKPRDGRVKNSSCHVISKPICENTIETGDLHLTSKVGASAAPAKIYLPSNTVTPETPEIRAQNTNILSVASNSFPNRGESDWNIFQLLLKQVQGRRLKVEGIIQKYSSLDLTHKLIEKEDDAMLVGRLSPDLLWFL
uniref:Uncharacterized protein n=1 Tax=Physcomitrium patens TaxID=3218 RepID=A0A2K1L0D2_PHYPA|nr:hypothetical protein PHYPA_002273 [Physcomitrium patens]